MKQIKEWQSNREYGNLVKWNEAGNMKMLDTGFMLQPATQDPHGIMRIYGIGRWWTSYLFYANFQEPFVSTNWFTKHVHGFHTRPM